MGGNAGSCKFAPYQLQVERIQRGRGRQRRSNREEAGAIGQGDPVAEASQQRQRASGGAVATQEGGKGGQGEAMRSTRLQQPSRCRVGCRTGGGFSLRGAPGTE
jgi:hypothetical protein